MFNEIDRLILDSIVICPHCKNKNVKCIDFNTIHANVRGDLYGARASFENRMHEHSFDFSDRIATYHCNICLKDFKIRPLNACACGWKQCCVEYTVGKYPGYKFV